MKYLIAAVLLAIAPNARAGDKAKLRSALRAAHLKAFALAETLIGAQKGYSLACSDEHAAALIVIEKVLENPVALKAAIAKDLETAAREAEKDAAAHDDAVALVDELQYMPAAAKKAVAEAKRCVDFVSKMSERDSSEADLFKWDGMRMHSNDNLKTLSGIDVSAELKAAQALVEKTK